MGMLHLASDLTDLRLAGVCMRYNVPQDDETIDYHLSHVTVKPVLSLISDVSEVRFPVVFCGFQTLSNNRRSP